MPEQKIRGSEKLMAAWNARTIGEDAFGEIAQAIDESPATLTSADVSGGEAPTGVQLSLSYADDDVPLCGNDLLFWLRWHRKYGGRPRPPRIIIDGTPFPDLVLVDLDFGHAGPRPQELAEIEQPDAGGFVESDGSVLPLTHELSRDLRLGSLHDERLGALAAGWLSAGQGDRLAGACERTWAQLTAPGNDAVAASYWYDEVAARTQIVA